MLKILANVIARRPWLVLGVWLVIIGISVPLANLAPSRFGANTSSLPGSEYAQVINLLAQRFHQDGQDTTVLVSESTRSKTDPDFKRAYDGLMARLKNVKGILGVQRFDADYPLKLSGVASGKTITATLIQTPIAASATVDGIRREVRRLEAERLNFGLFKNELQFFVTGSTAVTRDFAELGLADAKRGELTGLPLVAIVLVFAFGALVAAGVPILVGVASITVTLAALWVVSHVVSVSSFALTVVTLLALGAGIDYALLIVNRFREELDAGRDPRQAAANTTRTAGRAVIFSGLTVAVAMAGLLVPSLEFVRAMGLAGVLVILVTVLVSVTAVPAALALLGDRVNMPRLAYKRALDSRSNAFWGRWADAVMRHPWRSSLIGGGIILVLALPALTMKLGYTGPFGLAPGVESRRGLELIRPLELGGALDSFEVVVDLGQTGAYNASARDRFRALDTAIQGWNDVRLVVSPFIAARLAARSSNAASSLSNASGSSAVPSDGSSVQNPNLGDVSNFTQRFLSGDRRYVRLSVIPKEPVRSPDIGWWMDRLRSVASKVQFGVGNERVLVGGAPVGSKEFTDAIVNVTPLAVGLVFAATFILLGIAFRSILIPIKSIIMNTLTVAASYGVITLVFQHGVLANLFGAPTDVGAIDSSLPLVMFAVTFGLSMDYEVFLLSRVQEAHLSGLDARDATRVAIERTAGVITSAALIMLIVFAAFIPGSVVANKTIGLGLAVAVLLDATIVRLVLVPAVMVMAGRWNWWLPAPLRKIMPRVSLDH
jgi:putative drug exporter of the RND superfamily